VARVSVQAFAPPARLPKVFYGMFGTMPTVSVLSLSDTIIVAAQPPADANVNDRVRWGLVDLVCQCVTYVMRHAAQHDPPLAYRGAVNFGRMLIDGAFLLGPAVDDVSEAMGLADGAFVWLMPAADALPPFG
jgi:hypothetical protein